VSFFVAFDAEGVLGSRSVVPLSSPSSALQLEMEGHAAFVELSFSVFSGSRDPSGTSSTSCDGPTDAVATTSAPPRGWKAVGVAVEEVDIAVWATAIVSGDGGGGGNVVATSAAVKGGRIASFADPAAPNPLPRCPAATGCGKEDVGRCWGVVVAIVVVAEVTGTPNRGRTSTRWGRGGWDCLVCIPAATVPSRRCLAATVWW
jgi:hypothetical protein